MYVQALLFFTILHVDNPCRDYDRLHAHLKSIRGSPDTELYALSDSPQKEDPPPPLAKEELHNEPGPRNSFEQDAFEEHVIPVLPSYTPIRVPRELDNLGPSESTLTFPPLVKGAHSNSRDDVLATDPSSIRVSYAPFEDLSTGLPNYM
jgi:hypothetical protein